MQRRTGADDAAAAAVITPTTKSENDDKEGDALTATDGTKDTIFFSWQSDLLETRSVIGDALKRAAGELRRIVPQWPLAHRAEV